MAGSFGSNVIRGGGGSGDNAFSAVAPYLMQLSQMFMQQSQGEKYPEEYAPLVEQYLRNLATQEQR